LSEAPPKEKPAKEEKERSGFFYRHSGIIFILLIFSFLVLFKLDENYFRNEEAETANLARNILKYRVPRVWDETNLIELADRKTANESLLWTYSPWVQYYLAAGSFRLLGETTFAGRLPFAILSTFSIVLLYRLARRQTGNRTLGILSAFLLAFSAYFILSSRECRFYAPLVFATILTVWCYLGLKGFWGLFGLVVSGTILFHTSYYALAPLIIAFWLHAIIFERKLRKIILLFIWCAVMAGAAFAYFHYFKAYPALDEVPWPGWADYLSKIMDFSFWISPRIIPLIFLLLSFIFILLRKTLHKRQLGLCLLIFIVSVGIFPIMGQRQRIVLFLELIPVGAFLVALLYENLKRISETLAATVLFLFIIFTVFSDIDVAAQYVVKHFRGDREALPKAETLKKHLRSAFFRVEYVGLLRHYLKPAEGAERGIAAFLNERAKDGDAVAVSFSHLSTMFYTRMRVVPRVHSGRELAEARAEIHGLLLDPFGLDHFWFIPQQGHLREFDRQLLEKIEAGEVRYEKYETQYPDRALNWEEQIGVILGRGGFKAQRLVIYKVYNK